MGNVSPIREPGQHQLDADARDAAAIARGLSTAVEHLGERVGVPTVDPTFAMRQREADELERQLRPRPTAGTP